VVRDLGGFEEEAVVDSDWGRRRSPASVCKGLGEVRLEGHITVKVGTERAAALLTLCCPLRRIRVQPAQRSRRRRACSCVVAVGWCVWSSSSLLP
jgi:hypothetical protein